MNVEELKSILNNADLAQCDPAVAGLLGEELERQRLTIQLIASENFASPSVLLAAGSVLTNKYSEGYPGRRYYGGNEVIDEVESLAKSRLENLFGAEASNVQPHSGASANLAAYFALLEPGDTILSMPLDQGGHLTHGAKASITSKIFNFVSYGLTPENGDMGERIDLDQVRDVAKQSKPKLILAGTTVYTRQIDPVPFREIADEVGALFMFDAAHPMGLIAGGHHPSPVGVADVVTFTTHKTLRGPRSGSILMKEEFRKKIDSALFPGLQGGPLEHIVAAKAVAFFEASQPYFRGYAEQIILNAKALAKSLKEEGFRIVSGDTENHQVWVDLRPFDSELSGKDAQEVLDSVGITLNRNQVPNDPRPPFQTSGLRLGTPAMTTAGMKEDQMDIIGKLISKVLRNRNNDALREQVRKEILELCSNFDPYPLGSPWPGKCF